jgi:hypothetical protein
MSGGTIRRQKKNNKEFNTVLKNIKSSGLGSNNYTSTSQNPPKS